MAGLTSSAPAPYSTPTMRQYLRDLAAGLDPLARFKNPRSHLAIEATCAVQSRGWVRRDKLTLTRAGREYVARWCNPES